MEGLTMNEVRFIEKKLKMTQKQIINVGAFRPGSLSKQYNVCGKADCICKDKKNPQKHGPYYKISYYLKKKHKTSFVPERMVKQIESELKNHVIAKELFEEWTALNTEFSNLRLKTDRVV